MTTGAWPVPEPPPVTVTFRGGAWPDWEYLLNSGGPRSRTRTERIRSTVLGDDDGPIRCPQVLRVGIHFDTGEPLDCARRWLKKAGFGDEHEARAVIGLPASACICRIDPLPDPVKASKLRALEGLRLVLILGLCTPWLYDPQRPVLWTRASLTRHLLLYDGGGFYA